MDEGFTFQSMESVNSVQTLIESLNSCNYHELSGEAGIQYPETDHCPELGSKGSITFAVASSSNVPNVQSPLTRSSFFFACTQSRQE